jgi:hypothetical protein
VVERLVGITKLHAALKLDGAEPDLLKIMGKAAENM